MVSTASHRPVRQARPPAQSPESRQPWQAPQLGQAPPQSTSDSSPDRTPSAHDPASAPTSTGASPEAESAGASTSPESGMPTGASRRSPPSPATHRPATQRSGKAHATQGSSMSGERTSEQLVVANAANTAEAKTERARMPGWYPWTWLARTSKSVSRDRAHRDRGSRPPLRRRCALPACQTPPPPTWGDSGG